MRRNLKIYWLNFAVVLSVLAGSAVWQAGEADKSTLQAPGASPDGRYHWADGERDVLIEIKSGEYTETQKTGESALREVVSSGYCFQSAGRILLSEQELRTLGHSDPLYPGLGLTSRSYEHRIAGDYQIAISNPVQPEALEFSLPGIYDPFENLRRPKGRVSVSLTYRH